MDTSSISNLTAAVTSSLKKSQKTADTAETTAAESTATTSTASNISDLAAVYEKSSASTTATTTTTSKSDRSAIIAQLQADAEANKNQLLNIVKSEISKQGNTIATADDMWKMIANGEFTADAETIAKAQADIADDGYWGVEQTSDRIVEFAKILSGGDTSYAEELIDAFKEGFSQATSTWGKTLPDISQKTYDAVLSKFDAWVNGTEDSEA